jgi:hypothetical protein
MLTAANDRSWARADAVAVCDLRGRWQSPSNVHRYRLTGIRNRNPGARIYGQVQVLTLTTLAI